MSEHCKYDVRRIAIHEAGHAVAAWAMKVKVHKIELADGDQPLTDVDGSAHPDVAAWVINSTRIDVEGNFYEPQNAADQLAFRYYKSCIEQELPVNFAGVVAESVYTGEDIESLLTKGGRSDAQKITTLLSLLKKMGATDADITHIRAQALNKAIQLVNQYQWEITGIAMIVAQWEVLQADEFYNYMMLFTRQGLRPAV